MYDHYFADSTSRIARPFRKKALDEVDFIIQKTKLKTGSVLYVPCGTGRHSYLLAKKGLKVTGIDISEACLKIANKSWGHKNLSYQISDMSVRSQRNPASYFCRSRFFFKCKNLSIRENSWQEKGSR
jgi:2-polyprenyl-3-methyl-5-hydroxy-6-metoxy-1,4-benzoquinol methylase